MLLVASHMQVSHPQVARTCIAAVVLKDKNAAVKTTSPTGLFVSLCSGLTICKRNAVPQAALI